MMQQHTQNTAQEWSAQHEVVESVKMHMQLRSRTQSQPQPQDTTALEDPCERRALRSDDDQTLEKTSWEALQEIELYRASADKGQWMLVFAPPLETRITLGDLVIEKKTVEDGTYVYN
uniref:Uncharacterized protein n=1 Tax=Lygus hesperus TaxID=30085 RepID=A0A0A9W114_LYGHE